MSIVHSQDADHPHSFAQLQALIKEDDTVYFLTSEDVKEIWSYALYVRSKGVTWQFRDRPLEQSLTIVWSDDWTWHEGIPSYYQEKVDPTFDLNEVKRIRETFFKEYGEVIYIPHTGPVVEAARNLLFGPREQFIGQTSEHASAFNGDWQTWIEGLRRYPYLEQIRALRVLVANAPDLKEGAATHIRSLMDHWKSRQILGHHERIS